MAETYGTWGDKKMYDKTFTGIFRSHFVIDGEGLVADAQEQVSPKDSVEKALAAF